jgi:putative ABC transport system permease protein
MDTLRQDFSYALRLLWKNPGFALVTVLVFALGIGINVAIFTLVNTVLLRPLAYAHPERLVVALHQGTFPVSPADYFDYKRQVSAFEDMGAAQAWGANLSGGSRPESVPGLRMSSSLFRVLRTQPLLGRTFTPEEEHGAAAQVLVLSYRLWQTHFGASPSVIGSKVRLDGVPFTVIGVMPREFRFAPFWATRAQMWSPLVLDQRLGDRGGRSLRVFARLKPNVTLQQAQSEMDRVAQRLAETYPNTNKNLGISVVPLREKVVGQVRPTLMVLMATVGFVLLIACANVANFALTRMVERRKEFALRKAVGASSTRLIRMILTEMIVLGCLGGGAGILMAYSLTDVLPLLLPLQNLPRMAEIGVDTGVLLFAIGATLASVLIAGLTPMLQVAGSEISEPLKESGRSGSESAGKRRVRSILVGAEVALSLVLLAGAGLMIRTMQRLQSVDAGFDPNNVLSFQVALGGTDFDRNGARLAVFQQVRDRLAALPGVRSVSAINHLPIGGDIWTLGYQIEGRPAPPPGQGPSAAYRVVMPGYFNTMRIAILQGRDFTEYDRASAPRVAIINEALARRQWPGQDPIGHRFQFGVADQNTETFTVIGIVKNAKQNDWTAPPGDEIYLSYLQRPDSFGLSYLTFVARTAGNPELLTQPALAAVSSVDKDLAVSEMRSMNRVINDYLWRSRVAMLLLTTFAGISLALAGIGIYGVVSYSVKRRTQEIGIRMALGAAPLQVLQLAFSEGMRPIAVGAVAGLCAALALARLMKSLLYEVSVVDPLTFGLVMVVLGGIIALAILIPALRAARLDPVQALRIE